MVATNFARYLAPDVVRGIGALAGIDLDIEPGQRLPDEVLAGAQNALERLIAKPDDIADVVLYTLSLPRRLNIPDIVVRPGRTWTSAKASSFASGADEVVGLNRVRHTSDGYTALFHDLGVTLSVGRKGEYLDADHAHSVLPRPAP